jgi:hypothetical protein
MQRGAVLDGATQSVHQSSGRPQAVIGGELEPPGSGGGIVQLQFARFTEPRTAAPRGVAVKVDRAGGVVQAAPIQALGPVQGAEQAGEQEEGAHENVKKRSGNLARTHFFRET